MAIDPNLLIIKPVGELPTKLAPTSSDKFLLYDGQDLAISQWSNVLSEIKSGITGVATKTNAPTPYNAVTYPNGLFETYVVRQPLTLPNSWGSAVTQAELDANYVFFDVKNGVIVKQLSVKPEPNSAKIETWSAKTFTVGSQVVHNSVIYQSVISATALDIPSEESSVWKVIGGSNVKLDVSGGALAFDTFINNVKTGDKSVVTEYPSTGYEVGFVYDTLTGERRVNSSGANSGYIPVEAGDLIKIYAYSSASSGVINNGLITDKNKVRIKSLKTMGTGQRLEFVDTVKQDGFVVANTAIGYGTDYLVQIITSKREAYYLEWSKERSDLFLNRKRKEIFVYDSTIPYTLPSTTTTNELGTVFYDINDIPLPVGFYQLKIWQSKGIVTAALKVSGVFARDISPKVILDSERINVSSDGYSNITFEVTEANATLDINVLELYPNAKINKGSKGEEFVKAFLTPDDLEDLSVLSKSKSAEIPSPKSLLKLEFNTNSNLPTVKGTSISGVLKYNDFQGNSFKKFATLGVQGTSSAGYPKKNWTFELFNDAALTSKFELSIGKLISHSEFIFKSDYVDITHTHNIVGNHIWEQIVQSRNGYPKRETELSHVDGNNNIDSSRFDTKAIGHVEGFACELVINGVFYGLGNFNIGKKRNNYNIDNSNPNHVQLGDAIGQQNLYSFTPSQWELRSPKVSGYEEGQPISDSNVMSKINRLFSFNASSQSNITANIDDYYMRRNIVDYYIFTQTIYNFDGVSKNYLLTTWDGNVWAFMPYDLDSIFGMQFNGSSFFSPTANVYAHQNLNPNTLPFWNKIYQALKVDIDNRYAELRENILNIDNFYLLIKAQETKYGLANYKKEISRWSDRPKLNSVPRIMDYMQKRFDWLDSYFGYQK